MTDQDKTPEVDMNALIRARARTRWDPFTKPEPKQDTDNDNPKDAA